MKKIIILFFLYNFGYSQTYIIKLVAFSNVELGKGYQMFYLNDNLDQTLFSLSNMNGFNEPDFLAAFGLPLVEIGKSNCKTSLQNKTNENFIRKSFRQHILSKKGLDISIEISEVELKYCQFILTRKYWVSYYTNFEKAGMITDVSKQLRIRREAKNKTRMIIKLLENNF